MNRKCSKASCSFTIWMDTGVIGTALLWISVFIRETNGPVNDKTQCSRSSCWERRKCSGSQTADVRGKCARTIPLAVQLEGGRGEKLSALQWEVDKDRCLQYDSSASPFAQKWWGPGPLQGGWLYCFIRDHDPWIWGGRLWHHLSSNIMSFWHPHC